MTATTDDRGRPGRAARRDLDEGARLAVLERYGLLGDSAPGEGDHERDVSLSRLAQLAAQVCGTSAAVVNIITADAQRQVAAWGIEPDVCARGDSMCAVVFESGSTTVLADARTDSRFARNPWVSGVMGRVRLYASAPLVTADGVRLGSLCAFDPAARELTAEQVAALETLAHQVVDVLDLQLRTRELRATTEELTRSNQLLGEFAGRVSHDLRAPLAAISGFAELAHDELAAVDERATGHVARIRRAAGRMHAMLTELLAFASLGGTPEVSAVRLSEVVDDVREDLVGVIAGSGAQISVQDAVLQADRGQLRALLQNTVANAIAYRHRGRDGDDACRVEVVGEALPDGWRLRVVDHGPGIAARDRARVLEPFVRGASSAGVPGTGLGLATVARIAAAHGGALTLEETPGGGTTVTVTVPAG